MDEQDRLEGGTAVVLGAGSGIGEGLATDLARRRMRLLVADLDGERAERVADGLRAEGADVHAAAVDATDRLSLGRLAELAGDRLGAVNLMASTVGAIVDRRLDEATDEDWAWLLELNLMSHVRTVDAFRPLVRAAEGYRHLMVTSSTAGLMALGRDIVGLDNGLYTTTKFALVGYAEMLRLEVAPEGIGVSVLCPGFIAGRLTETSSQQRPERFGGPFSAVKPRGPGAAMPAVEAGRIIADGLAARRFYLCTHSNGAAVVERRHRELVAAFHAVDAQVHQTQPAPATPTTDGAPA